MKEHFFEKKGLYYRTNLFQTGRPTLVFVHGMGGSSSAWIPFEQKFQNKYNILSFDLRGHGKSIKPPNYEDYEIKKFAEDIADLILHLNMSRFMLVSHSFGTLIALQYMALFGTNVSGAVFLSPSFNVKNDFGARILYPFLWFTRLFYYLPFTGNPTGHVDYSKYPNKGDWNISRSSADIGKTTLRVYSYCTRQSYAFDQENLLEKIYVPTLIIHGKKDTVFSHHNSIYMDKKIKNSKLILLAGANHVLVLNNVKEICDATESFIERHKEL